METKYAIYKVVNGNFFLVSEHGNNLQQAIVNFLAEDSVLWNEPSVKTATIAIVDQNMDVVEGRIDYIKHSTDKAN